MASDDCVVLFKSVSETESEDEDEYQTLLRSHFQVTLIPVLDFEFINLDKMLDKLKKPDDFEGITHVGDLKIGIIFSSPRCVVGVEKSVCQSGNTSIWKSWHRHKHFAVGEGTSKRLGCLGLTAKGTEAGNANKLAEIMSRDHFRKPFLYPKGSMTKDTFKSTLEEKGILTDDVIIYKTKPHPALESNITKIKPKLIGKTIYFVYFSPSGVNFTLPILQSLQFDLSKIKFIAIGATTAKGIAENGLKVSATSSAPNPSALLKVVMSVM